MERKTYALGNLPKPVLRPDFHKLDDLCGEIFQNFLFAKWKDIDHKNTNRCIYIKSCKDLCWRMVMVEKILNGVARILN